MPSPGVTEQIVKDIVMDRGVSTPAAGALARATDRISHDGDLGIVHTVITLQSDLTLVTSVDNAAKAGGAQVFTFPQGFIQIHRARIKGTLGTSIADLTSTAGEIGLGIVVATGAVAVLGGTATFESILEGGIPALGNFTAGNDLAAAAAGGAKSSLLGGFSSSVPMFLNLASTWGDVGTAGNVVARAGTQIEVWWSRIPG